MEFKVMRIGTIKVKMFDMIVKALGNVRHVLELERKLILLSWLDSLGYVYYILYMLEWWKLLKGV